MIISIVVGKVFAMCKFTDQVTQVDVVVGHYTLYLVELRQMGSIGSLVSIEFRTSLVSHRRGRISTDARTHRKTRSILNNLHGWNPPSWLAIR